ncbi:MAG TPA: hypothetical protein VKX25_04110 [Bryobacteraceae bacterium]|jgi:tetratricopeptide (TPR) repeat protein|nr:hypothetical protein [Bryobacteraceae bacterium]
MLAPSPADRRKMLERILASRAFSRAEQLRRLLAYVVDATLDGREDTLKETVLGVDLFGLSADFDPKSDPVVRMAMRRLRDRLRQYYSNEGAADFIVISLEPGSYVPRFGPRSSLEQPRVPIAVLPLESSTAKSEDVEAAGLVRDALLSRLAQNTSFRLVANEWLPSRHDLHSDVIRIGRRLQVRFLVRGACLSNGGKIRVSTELVRTDDGESLWSGDHEQDLLDEIWTVQNEIAGQLEKHALEASGRPSRPVLDSRVEPGIYRLMVQGRYYLNQNSREAFKKSESCFLKILEKQPASSKAWAGLSIAQSLMTTYHMLPVVEGWHKARLSAEKSIACDPTAAEGYTGMGLLAGMGDFQPALAGQYFERALAVNPEDHSSRVLHAMICRAPLGQLQEAEDQLEIVLTSDPLNPKALQMMASVLHFQRRYQLAADVALSALDIMPDSLIASFTLANAYDRLGREGEALNMFRKCEERMPFMRVLKWPAVLAAIYKGRTKWVRPSLLAAAKSLQSSARAPSAMLAQLLIRLGEHERAIFWIERAFRERAIGTLYLAVDPAFDPVRSDPRCRRLIESIQRPADEAMPTASELVLSRP